MIDFEELVENIKDFFSDSTKRILFICSILLFMTLCALFILILNMKKPEKKADASVRRMELKNELLIPSGPEVPDEYVTSRQTPEKWSDSDCDEWFTVPGQSEIKKLREVNSKMADDILGAAP